MNIEIKTTTVKLTKSIITQMQKASPAVLLNGECLGYVSVVKGSGKSLIIRRDGKYYTFQCHWDRNRTDIRNATGGWTFTSPEECDDFWKKMNIMINRAEQIYI